jgi:hypothetical protein
MNATPSPQPLSLRSFYVHVSDGPAGGGHLITDAEDSFEAALLFAERWAPETDPGAMLRVHVIDGFTGERCCFTIDIGTGEVGPC